VLKDDAVVVDASFHMACSHRGRAVLYLLTAARGQHLNLRLVTQNFQEPNLDAHFAGRPLPTAIV
jgi:hypothetical protein